MNEPETASQAATPQMLQALARWEQDGGARASTKQNQPAASLPLLGPASVWAEIALRQGMRLERCDRGAANYRLVIQEAVPSQREDPANFKLTLGDVETILMNSNPA